MYIRIDILNREYESFTISMINGLLYTLRRLARVSVVAESPDEEKRVATYNNLLHQMEQE